MMSLALFTTYPKLILIAFACPTCRIPFGSGGNLVRTCPPVLAKCSFKRSIVFSTNNVILVYNSLRRIDRNQVYGNFSPPGAKMPIIHINYLPSTTYPSVL